LEVIGLLVIDPNLLKIASFDGRMDYTLGTGCRSGKLIKWVCSSQSMDGRNCQR